MINHEAFDSGYNAIMLVIDNRKEKISLVSSKAYIREAIKQHVELISTWASEVSFKDLRLGKSLLNVYIDLDLFFTPRRRQINKSERLAKLKIFEIFQYSRKHTVLLGQPGSGKTTSVKKICHDIIAKNSAEKFDFPLLLRIADFTYRSSDQSIFKYIFNTLGLEINSSTENKPLRVEDETSCIEKCVIAFLNATNVLVIIDGYDEIPMQSLKEKITSDLRNLSLSLHNSKLLITSRSSDFNIHLENSIEFEICPLTDDQIKEFAESWFKDKETSKLFLGEIKKSSYFDTLVRPVFLSLLCSIYERSGKLYDKPKVAYEKMLRLLLEEWDEQRSVRRITKYSHLEIDTKIEFLCHLAFYLTYIEGALRFNRQTLIKAYAKIHAEYDLPKDEYLDVIEELETHTGIFVQDTYDTFKFYHKSFQEYLCAKYLTRYPNIPDINLAKMPNEMAIATCIQKSTEYFIELVFAKVKDNINIDFISSYINRLYIEKPAFAPDKYLALAFLYISSEVTRSTIDNKSLGESLKHFLSLDIIGISLRELYQQKNFRLLTSTQTHYVFHFEPSGKEKYDLKYLYGYLLKLDKTCYKGRL